MIDRFYRRCLRWAASFVAAVRRGADGVGRAVAVWGKRLRVWAVQRGVWTHRVRTPTVLQMEHAECGAAALGIVLGAHGRHVPLTELRSACGVSRDGSRADRIVAAARDFGLKADGFKVEDPQRLMRLPLPFIVHWKFNHFVVVEGYGRSKVHLNDPATGPRAVPIQTFARDFTGVVLAMQPSARFEAAGARPTIMRALWERTRASTSALAFVVAAGLGLALPGLALPALSKLFVDSVFPGELAHWLPSLIGIMAAVTVLVAGLTWAKAHFLLRLETKLALDASARFVRRMLRLPMRFFGQRYAGDLAGRVSLNNRIARVLSSDVASTAISVATAAFYVGLMAQYSPLLTAVGIGIVGVNVVVLYGVARRRRDLSHRMRQDQSALDGVSADGLRRIESLKASGAEGDFFAKWAGHQARVEQSQQKMGALTHVVATAPSLLTSLNVVAIIGLGGFLVLSGDLTLGILVALHALALRFLAPFNRLMSLGHVFQEVEGDLHRLDDVLQHPEDPHLHLPTATASPTTATPTTASDRASEADPLEEGQGLTLDEVTFAYGPHEPPVVDGVSLDLAPGTWGAVVGRTGSGKSTLARLACGLYAPSSGAVRMGGRPVHALTSQQRAATLAYVDQDVVLFEGTVRENLTLWRSDVPDAAVESAARSACIHEHVVSRPGGYAAAVQEDGRNFSGGQRQRLEIARALVDDPDVLVFDEATSALDPRTEKQVMERLVERGATALVVAHRLSTIRDADTILVMEAGRVVQRGTHESLRHHPPYADLLAGEQATPA